MTERSHLVIGGGLIGMAAAKYLAARGSDVTVFAPPEPEHPETHEGVFSSHYDQRRLVRLTGRSGGWVEAARMAMDGYRELEADSGIDFFEPVGVLLVKADHVRDNYVESAIETARREGIDHTVYPVGDRSWRHHFGDYDFPDTHWLLHERAPAGMIDPRAMLRAQTRMATAHGARVVPEMVVGVSESVDEVTVTTSVGDEYRGHRALVAAGAFTNFCHLLPRQLELQVKSEVVVLGEVAATAAAHLRSLPTVSYSIDHREIADIYLTPPARYENGRHYFKMGANTSGDVFPSDLAEAQAWFHGGDSERWRDPLAEILRSMLPGVDFLSFETRRCIITRTPNGFPMIDRLSDRLFVATGGNGSSAKCSDTWGRLASCLVQDTWLPRFPRARFKAIPRPQ